jgi:phospholipid/cholesterol/gamma-HCH transport system substrate-binding protein
MRRATVALLVGVLIGLPACATHAKGYRMTAYFPQTVAFYSRSRVKLMGLNVGTVDSVQIDGNQVRVQFTVDHGVPLPADVHAAIMPLSLIGERNLTLFPPWQPGQPLATDGEVIPESRTQVPVEIDAILRSVTNLVNAINPADVKTLVVGGAAALKGHGQEINNALVQVTDLTGTLADQDQELLAIAANVHQLAQVLQSRQQELATLIDDFAQATSILASERQQLTNFLTALAQLSEQGQLLLQPVAQQLPGDIATLTQVVLTVQVNEDGLERFVQALPGVARVVEKSYDPAIQMFTIRIDVTSTVAQLLAPLFKSLGIPLPCLNLPGQSC